MNYIMLIAFVIYLQQSDTGSLENGTAWPRKTVHDSREERTISREERAGEKRGQARREGRREERAG